MVKATYVLMQLVALSLGIWKVNGMGLLPWVFVVRFHYYIPADGLYSTTASDWLAWETARQPLERAIIAL